MKLIKENVQQFYYEATYDLGYNLSDYYYDPAFLITIRDIYTGREQQITKDNFKEFNVTKPSNEEVNEWLKESLEKNNGLIINVNKNEFYIMQWLYCENEPNNIQFGWNTSEVTLFLTEGLTLNFYTKLLPKLYRTSAYQYDNSKSEPILTQSNKRPDFDFGTPVEFDNIKTNMSYKTIGDLYVNTSANDNDDALSKASPMVPLYVTDVTAFESNVKLGDAFYYNTNEISSTIYDIYNDIRYPLPLSAKYENGEIKKETSANVIVYPEYTFNNSKINLSANLTFYQFKQLIYNSAGTPMFKRNRIEFGMHTNEGIEPLFPLNLTFDSSTIIFKKGTLTHNVTLNISNPNMEIKGFVPKVEYKSSITGITVEIGNITGSDGNYNVDITIKYSDTLKTNNALSFIAYIEQETKNPPRTKEVVKEQTTVYGTVNCIYETEALSPVQISFSNYYPESMLLTSRYKTGSAVMTIINPNEEYNTYEIFYDSILPAFTGDDGTEVKAVIQNVLQTNNTLTAEIVNISANSTDPEEATYITVSSYLNEKTFDWPIEYVKSHTSAEETTEFGWSIAADPYEELRNCSLYSPHDLILNGGYIGSKDILCANLTGMNSNCTIDAPVYVASGTNYGTAYFKNGVTLKYPVSAERITFEAYDGTISVPLYANKSLTLNKQIADTVYLADGATLTLNNQAKVNNKLKWEKPELPTLFNIPVFEFTIPSDAPSYKISQGSTQIFGKAGEFSDKVYINNLNLDNYANVEFYPGTYYINNIHTETQCNFIIHSDYYSSTNDTSVKLYIKNGFKLSTGVNFKVPQEYNSPVPGSTRKYGLAASFIIYFDTTGTISIDCDGINTTGILTCPKGTIELKNHLTWMGNIWANLLKLENGASLVITPYDEKDFEDEEFMERLKKWEQEHPY